MTDPTATDVEPELLDLRIQVCRPCVERKPGECHAPGCFYWMRRINEVPIDLGSYVVTPSQTGRRPRVWRDGDTIPAGTWVVDDQRSVFHVGLDADAPGDPVEMVGFGTLMEVLLPDYAAEVAHAATEGVRA